MFTFSLLIVINRRNAPQRRIWFINKYKKSGDFERENRGSLTFSRERLVDDSKSILAEIKEDIDIISDSDNDEDELEILFRLSFCER